MLQGDVLAGQWVAAGVIALSTGLNAAYFLPIVHRAFWRAPPKATAEHPAHGEANAPIVLALTATALGTIALFAYPDVVHALAEAVIAEGAAPAATETAEAMR
jgi:multicomponent Na+:H+ antiporter subunit D